MAEYVCELTDDYPDVDFGSDDYSGTVERRERVVRCRDCVHAYQRGGGIYCSLFLRWGRNDNPVPLPVEPDNFCAWGRKRAE